MPGINTRVAKNTGDQQEVLCINLICDVAQCSVNLPPGTAFVLIFEMCQERSNDDSDDQTLCFSGSRTVPTFDLRTAAPQETFPQTRFCGHVLNRLSWTQRIPLLGQAMTSRPNSAAALSSQCQMSPAAARGTMRSKTLPSVTCQS